MLCVIFETVTRDTPHLETTFFTSCFIATRSSLMRQQFKNGLNEELRNIRVIENCTVIAVVMLKPVRASTAYAPRKGI